MSGNIFAHRRNGGPSVVCIGVFDGVHLGHRKIIRETVRRAKALRLVSVGLTFDPHPSCILVGHSRTPMLCSVERRIELMREAGLDRCVVLPFTEDLARVSAESFVSDLLVKQLRAKAVCAGTDFRFGNGARGDAVFLRASGKKLGFEVISISPVRVAGKVVSSTRIRKQVMRGGLDKAATLLGRPFGVDGTVVKGDGRGKIIGFPTVNLSTHQETLPPQGVYAVLALCGGQKYAGALHLGPRPTFDNPKLRLEAHLLGTNMSFYGKKIRFNFIKRLRPIMKFSTINELCAQIQKDVGQVRSLCEREL